MSKIKVMLDDGAFMPERAHELDAGNDICKSDGRCGKVMEGRENEDAIC